MKTLSKQRFEALAGYTRQPVIILYTKDEEWHATDDERVLGVVIKDLFDLDFGWVALGRDKRLRYRAVDVNSSKPTVELARADLEAALNRLSQAPDEEFFQGDETGLPVDFFGPVASVDQLGTVFKILTTEERYSPAREIIAAMMRFHEDADGNFVQQFQTTAFDARLWELYLFATFTELGYAARKDIAVPDLVLESPFGRLGIEATTINPTVGGTIRPPKRRPELAAYLENYVPIKLATALKRKLNHQPAYWGLPHMREIPFVLAVQDFHSLGSMRMIVPALTEYLFGFRHRLENGVRQIERISEHRYENLVEISGFFMFPGAENVSAVIANPQGTITKFNRMGYLAEFGDRNVRMVRTGVQRGEMDSNSPLPKSFKHEVHKPEYKETWIEGTVVLHNPNARIPLNPDLIPGAAHEFLQVDGTIMSLLPTFQPLFSQTAIWIE
jgi:hypothetical protein